MSEPFEDVRQELHRRGWVKGIGYDVATGRVCLLGAVDSLADSGAWWASRVPRARSVIAQAVQELFPDRVAKSTVLPVCVVSRFNDHGHTTLEDVEAVLERASKIWERDHA